MVHSDPEHPRKGNVDSQQEREPIALERRLTTAVDQVATYAIGPSTVRATAKMRTGSGPDGTCVTNMCRFVVATPKIDQQITRPP